MMQCTAVFAHNIHLREARNVHLAQIDLQYEINNSSETLGEISPDLQISHSFVFHLIQGVLLSSTIISKP